MRNRHQHDHPPPSPSTASRALVRPPVLSPEALGLLSTLILSLVAALLPAAAQEIPLPGRIGVSPPRIELQIGDRPTTESIRVINLGTEPVAIKASVHSWDLDDENRIRLLPPTEQSLDQWMVLNPLEFSIEPGRSQTVRFSVRPRIAPEPGEHRAIVYFEQASGPVATTSTLRTVFRLGVAIYAYVGEVTRRGPLHGVEVVAKSAWFDISSEGSAHLRLLGQYAVWPAEAYPGSDGTERVKVESGPEAQLPAAMVHVADLPSTPILPGTRRRMELRLPEDLAPGSYVLDLNGTLGDLPLDRGVAFTVPEPVGAANRDDEEPSDPSG